MSEAHTPNLDPERMRAVLAEEDTGYLGLSRGDRPYIVPVSYALIDENIVIHGAMKGRKLDLIRANPQACFLVSRNFDPTRPHRPEKGCTYRFESVFCEGTARVVEDPAERLEWLRRFKAYFDTKMGSDDSGDPVGEKAAAHCSCIVLRIESMTGRCKAKRVQD